MLFSQNTSISERLSFFSTHDENSSELENKVIQSCQNDWSYFAVARLMVGSCPKIIYKCCHVDSVTQFFFLRFCPIGISGKNVQNVRDFERFVSAIGIWGSKGGGVWLKLKWYCTSDVKCLTKGFSNRSFSRSEQHLSVPPQSQIPHFFLMFLIYDHN